MDRIDIHIEVPRVEYKKLRQTIEGEPSARVRERVSAARAIQHDRFRHSPTTANAEMSTDELKAHCVLDEAGESLLEQAVLTYFLSPRSYTRILKLSRTIADLDSSPIIQPQHLAEAIRYKITD